MTKKILFVVNVDWFFISHRLPLAIEALRRGYEVGIACGVTDKREYLESLGFKVYSLSIFRSGTSIVNELKSFVSIYNIVKRLQPDIVHFITIKPVLYGGIASRFVSVKTRVFSISGLGFIFIKKGLKAGVVKAIVKKLYFFAFGGKNSHVIVQNPDDKEVVKSIKNVTVTLIRGSGVDLNEYKYIEENNDVVNITMACRLLKDKGVMEYAKAAKIIKEKGFNVVFYLYGDLDEGNPATLTNKELDTIKRDGFVTIEGYTTDIAAIFSNANIIVLPSYREGLPKVLIEAAACGRAVVTTDVPGCRDAIESNVTGLLCEVKDASSLAQEIEKLIVDTNLRNRMGKAGRKLAEKEFDINKVVEKHFEIYEANE